MSAAYRAFSHNKSRHMLGKQYYSANRQPEGMEIHRRLIELRNIVAAYTGKSDLVRITLAAKEEPDRVLIRHLTTVTVPRDEIPDFLEAVAQTEHFVTVSLNKQLDHLETHVGRKIVLD